MPMNQKGLAAKLVKLNHITHKIVLFIAQASILAMVAIVTLTVILRYCFNTGLSWAEEVPRLLVTVFAFIACAIGVRDHMHVAVNAIYNKFPVGGKVRKALDVLTDYGGKVPGTMEELLRLPGVGRKTANLLLGDLYAVPGSVVCDTHCIRICGRLGLSTGKEPEKVEQQLRKILPPEESSDFCHRIVLFGRDCCTARNPMCGECPLTMYCKEFNPQA